MAIRKTVTPSASRPTPAPAIATRPTPQAAATARMAGSADRQEVAATARTYGLTPAQAQQKINREVAAQQAAQGTRSSRPVGGSADRMEVQQVAKIYGVSPAQAQKIINTQTDIIRTTSGGTTPIYRPDQKVAAIPAPLVKSSGPGSLMSGWQPTGPVSSITGLPLRPPTKPTGGGGGGAGGGGSTGGGGEAMTEEPGAAAAQQYAGGFVSGSPFTAPQQQDFSPIADRTVSQMFGQAPTVRMLAPNISDIMRRFGVPRRGGMF